MAELITIAVLVISIFALGFMEERKKREEGSLKAERLKRMQ
jgi:hypothetical protein